MLRTLGSATLIAMLCGAGAGAAQHNVTVFDNFFTPADLTIQVGDSVRWTNGAGFHNVFSCTVTQQGCAGVAANETFGNGDPRNGPWVYTYTFTEVGQNPYLCQSHAAFMHGHITVVASGGAPPAVPDGALGLPMIVDKAAADGAALTVAWDDQTCPAPVYNIFSGTSAGLPDTPAGIYAAGGQVCDVASPFVWADSPRLLPGEWIWWLVVATDGAGTEGSWGRNTVGERTGPLAGGASGACGATVKDDQGDCTP